MNKAAIFFPINNKGGVGKTSVIKELALHLSRYYKTLFVDTDHQQTGYYALTGEPHVCEPYSAYLKLDRKTIEVPGVMTYESDPLHYSVFKAQPTYLDVLGLPIGTFHLHASGGLEHKLSLAEEKLSSSVDEHQAFVLDLPTMIDAELVLSNSVLPLLNVLKSQGYDAFDIYPIAVSSNSATVKQIGEAKLQEALEYLKAQQAGKVFPTHIINNVPAEEWVDRLSAHEKDIIAIGIRYGNASKEERFVFAHQSDAHICDYKKNGRTNVLYLAFPAVTEHKEFSLFSASADWTFFFPEAANLQYRHYRTSLKPGETLLSTDDFYRSQDLTTGRYLLAIRRFLHEVDKNQRGEQLRTEPSYYEVREGQLNPLPEEVKQWVWDSLESLCIQFKPSENPEEKEYTDFSPFSIKRNGLTIRPRIGSKFYVILDHSCPPIPAEINGLKAEILIDCNLELDTFRNLALEEYLHLTWIDDTHAEFGIPPSSLFRDNFNQLLSPEVRNDELSLQDDFCSTSGINDLFVMRQEGDCVKQVGIVYNYRVNNEDGEVLSPQDTFEDLVSILRAEYGMVWSVVSSSVRPAGECA